MPKAARERGCKQGRDGDNTQESERERETDRQTEGGRRKGEEGERE